MSYGARARSIGKKLFNMQAVKTSGIAAVAGVISGVGGAMAAEHVAWFQKYWYSLPVAVGIVGHVVKETVSRDAGAAMIGGAGVMGYYNYKLNRASTQSQPAAAGTSGVQGVADDYVAALRSLPETTGVQAPMSSIHSMRAAA